MSIRDRIKELRRVPARDLKPNPRNWRLHPDAQREAMRSVLSEVGWAQAALARELPDGTLELIDGHLRTEEAPDELIPTLIIDVDEADADKVLATLDPIGAMARRDQSRLNELIYSIDAGSAELTKLLSTLATDLPEPPTEFGVVDELIPIEHECPRCGYRWSGGEQCNGMNQTTPTDGQQENGSA